MSTDRPFFAFDDDSHAIWRTLYARQFDNCQRHGTTFWKEGVEALGIHGRHIPDFAQVNERVMARTGNWRLLSTEVQFSTSEDWFDHLERRIFLITEYIRGWDTLDYTPLPDIWHDGFGHLPFLAHREYVDTLERFGQVYNRTPVEARRPLGNLWWYSIEFGLMREGDEVKALGTGLMSSPGELANAFNGGAAHAPFDPAVIERTPTSHDNFHKTLFVLDNFGQLRHALEAWAAAHVPVLA